MNQVASVTSAANWMAWKNSWAAVTRREFIGAAPYCERAKSSSSTQYAATWCPVAPLSGVQ